MYMIFIIYLPYHKRFVIAFLDASASVLFVKIGDLISCGLENIVSLKLMEMRTDGPVFHFKSGFCTLEKEKHSLTLPLISLD